MSSRVVLRRQLIFSISALLVLATQSHSSPQNNRPARPTTTTNVCTTPRSEPGHCIPIEKCEPILVLFRDNREAFEVRKYAQRSQCGYNRESRYPSVCCPDSGEVPDIFNKRPTPAPTRPNRPDPAVHPEVPKPGNKPKPGTKPAVKPPGGGGGGVSPHVKPPGGGGGVSSHPNAHLLDTENCGLDYSQRIFGGNATDLDEFPWTAILQYQHIRNGNKRFRCGGVLISKRYVLTAAHCTSKADLNGYAPHAVRLGEYNTETERDCAEGDDTYCADPPLDFSIEKEIVHPDYKYKDQNKYNDIALFRLSADVPKFTDFIRPICIPLDPEVKVKNYVGKNLTVTGWGRTELASSSPVKLKAFLPVLANAECAQVYQNKRQVITDTQICAGGMRERDVCQGDSGGPMMSADYLERDMKVHYHVAGIVSFGPQCSLSEQSGKWLPGVYTRISQFTPWILDQLKP